MVKSSDKQSAAAQHICISRYNRDGFIICYKQTLHFMLQYWCWLYRQIKVLIKKKKQNSDIAYPSALPHCPGREEMHANSLPLPNCSSMWGSSVRPCWRFSSFLWTWLLLLASSAAASHSYPYINAPQKINDPLREKPSHISSRIKEKEFN